MGEQSETATPFESLLAEISITDRANAPWDRSSPARSTGSARRRAPGAPARRLGEPDRGRGRRDLVHSCRRMSQGEAGRTMPRDVVRGHDMLWASRPWSACEANIESCTASERSGSPWVLADPGPSFAIPPTVSRPDQQQPRRPRHSDSGRSMSSSATLGGDSMKDVLPLIWIIGLAGCTRSIAATSAVTGTSDAAPDVRRLSTREGHR
jgi:hypothetical protein